MMGVGWKDGWLKRGCRVGYNWGYAPVAQSDRALASEARCGGSSPSGRTMCFVANCFVVSPKGGVSVFGVELLFCGEGVTMM